MDIRIKTEGDTDLKGSDAGGACGPGKLSKGFISSWNATLTSPSIRDTPTDILQCLGTTLGEFFNETPEEQVVFGKADYFEKNTTRS